MTPSPSSTRPVIGVAWPDKDYVASLERAGADIRELAPGRDALPAALEACDGLLLTGGVDVDPAEYGEAAHPTVELAPERDAYELTLARLAIARDLPLLAICRGVQVLNVAAGGTLVQDIPSQQPSTIAHTLERPKHAIAHDVTIAPGTCLARLVGAGTDSRTIPVNSRHHQSVKDTAPGFVTSAIAPDGIVEAIERPDSQFCVGVQWHPENFWQTDGFGGIFTGLIDAARAFKAAKR